jgi:hypothetical protein
MLSITTKSGIEIQIPLEDIDSVNSLGTAIGAPVPPPHPYLHREGVNRCFACWRERTHPSHTDTAVHE